MHSVPTPTSNEAIESQPPAEFSIPADRGEVPLRPPISNPDWGRAPQSTVIDGSDDTENVFSAGDPAEQVRLLIDEAVQVTREKDRKAIPEIVNRIASISKRDDEVLAALLEAVLEVPSTGKDQLPLEISPSAHQKLKAAANRYSRPGAPSTMTTLVLEAIGATHESGKLGEFVDAHKAGERHKVPLFGNVKVGKAPRGEAKRMQFQPPNTATIMIDILAAWYRVDFVVLARLALDAHFNKRGRKIAETAADPV
ncbi:hypothetical protein AB0L82_35555 [Nocardia sp. NPDC052001]|uniref:hypothetical protein n=1 Tax=Nocardia sp. NPDC052001 TaxID=3154853 RepID=UPI00343624F6